MAFAACSETADDFSNAELTLTSERVMEFGAEGGTGTITYTLENARKGALPEVTVSDAWITNVTVGQNITFTVEVEDTGEIRSGRIYVSYGDKNFDVFVKQEAGVYVAKFAADKMVGSYLGSTSRSTYNMNVILTDLGYSESGTAVGGATYYRLDLYSATEPQLDAEGWMTIPAGIYSFDGSSTASEMTIGNALSAYYKLNEDASAYEAREYFDSAELVVTESGLTLRAYVTGTQHIVTYSNNKFFVGLE